MFHGSIPALVTPFAADGSVDWAALAAFVDWQVTSGSAGLVPCGTTGESATLTIDEHNAVVAACVAAAAGRVPVIAGCGSNDTAVALDHMRHAQASGAAAALVVCPYYNKPSQAGLFAHFHHLATRCDLPIVIYNIPGRSVVDMSVETMARLAELPTIVGVKDATGNLGRVSAQRAACGPNFCQLSGNDDLALGFAAMGGAGCISVSANVAPVLCAEFQAATAAGDYAAALALQDRLWPLHDALFADASPGPTKYALQRLGRMGPTTRLPVTPPSDAARARVDAALAHAGLSATEPRPFVIGHAPTGDHWTDEELAASVNLYEAIMRLPSGPSSRGDSLIRQWMAGPLINRNYASVTYRLRNISAVAFEFGFPVLAGFSPAPNVGGRVSGFLRGLLARISWPNS